MDSQIIAIAHFGAQEEHPISIVDFTNSMPVGYLSENIFQEAADLGYIEIKDGCFKTTQKGMAWAHALQSLLLGDEMKNGA